MTTDSPAQSIDSAQLRRLFYPRSVALVGASERSPWSHLLHDNLRRMEFDGKIYAVNKRVAPAHGYPAYASCSEIPETPDIAYIFVPIEGIIDVFEDVIAAGIKAAVILTSGFSETGADGAALQEQLVRRAREAGVVFLGPNCLGFANMSIRAPLTPVPSVPPFLQGKIALVSQSGATNSEIVEFAQQSNIGLSMYIATGNEALLDISTCLDFLVDDENTKVIMVFSETVRDTDTFTRAARKALAAKKPIVMLKAGSSELTAKVAAAHTGSLVGDDKVFDAACRQLGVIRVRTIEELVTTARLLETCAPLPRPGVGVVSISGGACTLIADRAEFHGVGLPAFSELTQSRLRDVLPGFAGTINPLDITGAAMREAQLFEKVLGIIGEDSSIGYVICVYNMPWGERGSNSPQLESIGKGLAALPVAGTLLNQTIKPISQKSREIMAANGIPVVLSGIDHVLLALGHVTRWSARVATPETPKATPKLLTGVRPNSEREVLDFLAAQGVPVIQGKVVSSRDDAIAHARSLQSPVALKIASPDIAHKTDVGGVKLNVSGDVAVGEAFDTIMASVLQAKPEARIDGILVSPMRSGGIELLVGTVRDPQWGTVLAVGVGGIWVELLADTQLRVLPVNAGEVKTMLGELRAARLLGGFRGSMPADLDKLAQVIADIGNAALALGPELETLEVNPLWVNGSQIEALDGLTVWSGDKH